MNGAYQIINFDDIEFTTGTAELVVGAYKKITDTAKRFVITHLNLDDEVYKDIQLTFENVEGSFVGTGVVNGKLAVVSIASTDQVTVALNDLTGNITSLENQISLLNSKIPTKYSSQQILFSELEWVATAGGIYTTPPITLVGCEFTNFFSVNIDDVTALRATDMITPRIKDNTIRLLSNTDTFQSNAAISLVVVGI